MGTYYGDQIWGPRGQDKYTILNNILNRKGTLFGLGFVETIPLSRLGFLGGVFLANHLTSTHNLTRTTKRENMYQCKLSK